VFSFREVPATLIGELDLIIVSSYTYRSIGVVPFAEYVAGRWSKADRPRIVDLRQPLCLQTG
jgi:hypothetical protein